MRLLNRTTRSVTLTAAGEELHSVISQPMDDISQAVEALNRFRDEPTGRIRLNLLSDAADLLLGPVLPLFNARYTGKKYGNSANTFKTPSFVVYDTTISYDLGRVSPTLKGAEASLNVQNLFDREYVSACNYAFGCYYGQERTASVEVSYDW